uniref:Defensin n=1 Tax=Parasteatoda tepidariorum TaxID=114398 RepID=A0A2L2YL55_PARTP
MQAKYLFLLVAVLMSAFAAVTVDAGFGCPFDQMRCHNHCKSVRYRGGYCTNFLKRTCKCYG